MCAIFLRKSSFLFLLTNACFSWAADVPTPTCNPTSIEAMFEPNPEPDPTFFPGQPYELTVVPKDLKDWPTTPTWFAWNSDFFVTRWRKTNTEIFDIPDPAPDTIYWSVRVNGEAIRPDCDNWLSNRISLTARRYDYVPTPTPVPTISPSPSPTQSLDCPLPDGECADIDRWPRDEQQNLPTSFTIVHNAVCFLHLETSSGIPHPYTLLDGQHVAVEGLAYNTWYMWYYVAYERYCPWIPDVSRMICWSMFKTMPSPTPTPSPSPSPLHANGWFLSMNPHSPGALLQDKRVPTSGDSPFTTSSRALAEPVRLSQPKGQP